MKLRSEVLVLVGLVLTGCGPSQHARMVSYEQGELACMQRYRTGHIQEAKLALVDHFRLIEQEERSGLPFRQTAYTKALIAARLALIYQQLGDTNQSHQQLMTSISCGRTYLREEAERSWSSVSDAEVARLMINMVTKLDENARPDWKFATTR